jgi:hypothetical protein
VENSGWIKSIGRALRNAQKQIDTDNIDPKLLKKLNMNKQEFIKFVDKYNGRVENKKFSDGIDGKAPQSGDIKMVGKKKQQEGKSNGVGNVKLDGKSGEKKDSGASQTPAGKVAPKHRKKLEAYFRAVSEGEEGEKDSAPEENSDSEK